ncbi:hypothetical protein N9W34_06955 [Rickettsiales bacterium]|nr:hypothetical protein [Rickettsiales bacterium]
MRILILTSAIIFLTSCSSNPAVIEVNRENDKSMSCQQLYTELKIAEKHKKDARAEDRFMVKHMFPLTAMVSIYNMNKAEGRAIERIKKINSLLSQRRCSSQSMNMQGQYGRQQGYGGAPMPPMMPQNYGSMPGGAPMPNMPQGYDDSSMGAPMPPMMPQNYGSMPGGAPMPNMPQGYDDPSMGAPMPPMMPQNYGSIPGGAPMPNMPQGYDDPSMGAPMPPMMPQSANGAPMYAPPPSYNQIMGGQPPSMPDYDQQNPNAYGAPPSSYGQQPSYNGSQNSNKSQYPTGFDTSPDYGNNQLPWSNGRSYGQ